MALAPRREPIAAREPGTCRASLCSCLPRSARIASRATMRQRRGQELGPEREGKEERGSKQRHCLAVFFLSSFFFLPFSP